jgi:hypothetical protein
METIWVEAVAKRELGLQASSLSQVLIDMGFTDGRTVFLTCDAVGAAGSTPAQAGLAPWNFFCGTLDAEETSAELKDCATSPKQCYKDQYIKDKCTQGTDFQEKYNKKPGSACTPDCGQCGLCTTGSNDCKAAGKGVGEQQGTKDDYVCVRMTKKAEVTLLPDSGRCTKLDDIVGKYSAPTHWPKLGSAGVPTPGQFCQTQGMVPEQTLIRMCRTAIFEVSQKRQCTFALDFVGNDAGFIPCIAKREQSGDYNIRMGPPRPDLWKRSVNNLLRIDPELVATTETKCVYKMSDKAPAASLIANIGDLRVGFQHVMTPGYAPRNATVKGLSGIPDKPTAGEQAFYTTPTNTFKSEKQRVGAGAFPEWRQEQQDWPS